MSKFFLLGNILHKSISIVVSGSRNLVLINWYRLCWKIGTGCRISGPIRRRAFLGEASFGRKCELGHNLVIDVAKGGRLVVGNGVSINGGTYISVLDNVVIGDNCRIGEYCSIRDNDHRFSDPDMPIIKQGMVVAAVKIGENVWLGRNVSIQKGVHVGNGAIIGANAFVNKDIPALAIAVGSPARIIGNRRNQNP